MGKPFASQVYQGRSPKRCLAGILALMMLVWSAPAYSCTLWGATGSSTAGDVTLIAKNRDWKPGQTHDLRQIRPPIGYMYLGLFAYGGDSPGLKAGINEKGLVVVTATASVIPGEERSSADGDPISSHEILTSFATVDELLEHKDRFIRSSYYMVADSTKVAVFEGAPDGKVGVRVTGNGFLAQTNHYISPELQFLNGRASESSRKRYARITKLLDSQSGQLTLENFVSFSEDTNAGPDNSIFRVGSSPKRSSTVATWIVAIPVGGVPELYVTMERAGQPAVAYSGKLDAAFWGVRTAMVKATDS